MQNFLPVEPKDSRFKIFIGSYASSIHVAIKIMRKKKKRKERKIVMTIKNDITSSRVLLAVLILVSILLDSIM